MNKLIKMSASLILLTTLATTAGVSTATADNCARQNVCVEVGGTNYNGTHDVNPTIEVDACFTQRELDLITLPDGTYSWVMYLVYENGVFERIVTLNNVPCRDNQFLTSGTRVAVFVTCEEYYGWVATAPVSQNGTYTMERADWDFDPTK